MNKKHLRMRIAQCLEIAKVSNCPRKKFGALLLDPERNVVLMDGYNGGPRGGGELCADDRCARDDQSIISGSRIEVGCHHAEMNVICNAAAAGVATLGAWLIINGEPCIMCAKLLHHAGIARIVIIKGVYTEANGLDYLTKNGVEWECVDIFELFDKQI